MAGGSAATGDRLGTARGGSRGAVVASLPATIRVGPYVYDVQLRPDDDGSSVWARIRYRERTLRVDPGLSPQMQRTAILHEVAHAVNDLGGFSSEKYWPKAEEQQVTATSPIWLLVLRDNPMLVEFLMAADG